MSKSNSTREEVELELARYTLEEDRLRLQLIDVQEKRKNAQYALNRLRREAGEIH